MSQIQSLVPPAAMRVRCGWSRGQMARNRRGERVEVSDSSACYFDPLGSILVTYRDDPARRAAIRDEMVSIIAQHTRRERKGVTIPAWNDAPNRQLHEVVAVLAQAELAVMRRK